MKLGSLDKLEAISCLCWSPDGLEIKGGTSNGSLWGLSMLFPGQVNDYGRVHSDAINCVAYSPTGTTIASASSDHTVQIWHVDTLERSAEPMFVLQHASAVHCLAFSPTLPVLATGTDHFHVWKVDTGQEIFRGILEGTLRCLSYSPDGSQVITTHGSDIRQRETNTRSFTGSKLEGHTDNVTCVSYSPKGDFIVSGSQDRSLRLWDLCHADLNKVIGHETMVTCLSFSQDGGSLASAASDGTFCLWNVERAILKLGPIHTPLGRINAVAYSPTLELVACAGAASYVGLWSTKTGVDTGIKLPRFLDATSVTRILFSPNDCFIAFKVDSAEDLLFVWAIQKLTSSAPLKLVLRVNTDGKKCAFHPSSNFVCIGDQAWSLQSHPPKAVSAKEGLAAIILKATVAEISYRYGHGFDWLYVGSPPRHAFAIPNRFNVVCHAVHSKIAALGGEDGRVVFIDCHRPAAQAGWRLNPSAQALSQDVNTRLLPSSYGDSVGRNSPKFKGNDFRVRWRQARPDYESLPLENPNGNKYVQFSSDSQEMASRQAVFDNVSTTSNVTCDVPDLTGSVRKLQRRPIFSGTYSKVYEGELDGKKVDHSTAHLVTTFIQRSFRWRSKHYGL
jgi:WD40 repeat protein